MYASSGPLARLKGKRVVVRARGVEYRGTLVEVAPEEIVLRAASGWLTIPAGNISQVLGEGETPGHLDPERVPSSFYDFEAEEKK